MLHHFYTPKQARQYRHQTVFQLNEFRQNYIALGEHVKRLEARDTHLIYKSQDVKIEAQEIKRSYVNKRDRAMLAIASAKRMVASIASYVFAAASGLTGVYSFMHDHSAAGYALLAATLPLFMGARLLISAAAKFGKALVSLEIAAKTAAQTPQQIEKSAFEFAIRVDERKKARK